MDRETQAMMTEMAKEAATQAVKQTLLTIGIDHNKPLEAQKDMAALRELRTLIDDPNFQKDMMHIRKWRVAMESVENKGIITSIGLVVAGGIALIIYGFKAKFLG